jgi:hypothetical protein
MFTCRKRARPLSDLLVRQEAGAEQRLAFDIVVECDLGTRQQALSAWARVTALAARRIG